MKYEYKTIVTDIEYIGIFLRKLSLFTTDKITNKLNDLGAQGWELVSVIRTSEGALSKNPNTVIHYLKRELKDK
jgi:hypothetical protein